MNVRFYTLAAALVVTSPVAIAQDLPTTQVQDHGQTVLHGAMTRSMLRSNRGNVRRSGSSNAAIARAKCASANRRAASGNGDPVLLRMCERAGLR